MQRVLESRHSSAQYLGIRFLLGRPEGVTLGESKRDKRLAAPIWRAWRVIVLGHALVGIHVTDRKRSVGVECPRLLGPVSNVTKLKALDDPPT